MSSVEQFNFHELLRFRYDLDIPGFVRVAVQKQLKREEILVSLHVISNISEATEKMPLFAAVSREKDLSRDEILVWLDIAYGGTMNPVRLSRKLQMPLHIAEAALSVLAEKGVLGDPWRVR